MKMSQTDTDEDYWWKDLDNVERDELEDMSPSMTLTFYTLYEGEEMRASELVEETLLPKRTVGHALSELHDEGYIESRPYLQNPNRNVYSLNDGESEDAEDDTLW